MADQTESSAPELVERFNERFPIFARVAYRAGTAAEYVEHTVKHPAQIIEGRAYAWLYGIDGVVAIDPAHIKYD